MRKVFVKRYAWGHERRRKQLRKLCKQGVVTMLENTKAGFLYGVPYDLKILKG